MSSTIKRHPDAVTLMTYAAGGLAEPLAAVVAAHAAMCPGCRAELADLELLGAALLLSGEGASGEAALGEGPIEVPARPQDGHTTSMARRRKIAGDRLPHPIAAAYGLTFERIAWKRLGPGILHHRLALSQGVEGDLRLLKISPGRMMPEHGHGGAELTLVLDGAYSDESGDYRCGDIQDVDEVVEHRPVADAIAGCICLIASERPARFKGFMGRLLQPLTGM